MDQALNSQKTPHTSPLRASYGMSFVSILMKNDRVIKGFYCTSIQNCKGVIIDPCLKGLARTMTVKEVLGRAGPRMTYMQNQLSKATMLSNVFKIHRICRCLIHKKSSLVLLLRRVGSKHYLSFCWQKSLTHCWNTKAPLFINRE